MLDVREWQEVEVHGMVDSFEIGCGLC
jgi:hypothetical protein